MKLAAGHLQKHGSDSPRLDAELLLAHSMGLRRLDLYMQFDRPATEAELGPYRALLARRAHGEPVAYVIGRKEFMALEFDVTPAVLVPNPDTEILVQRAVAIARELGGPMRVADVGTGSGCIAVALAHYAANAEVWATDISSDAIEVAARNVARHGLGPRVHLLCGDLLEPAPGDLHLVCANLPYVDPAAELSPEVLAQPAGALFAGEGGAEAVIRLLAQAPAHLAPGGRVLLEVDPKIVERVVDEARVTFAEQRIHRDLGGHERVVEAWS